MDDVSKLYRKRSAALLLLVNLLWLAGCDTATLLPPDARLPDGSIYSGEIKDGFFHGEGVQTFVDGMVYRGQFEDGYWQGEGVLEVPGRWRYEGQFEGGDFNGEGRFERDGDVFVGRFRDGEPVEGRHLTDYGTYHGEFSNWLYHGEGTFAYVDEYQGIGQMAGTWKNGEYVDEGAASLQDPPESEVEVPTPTERILTQDRQRLDQQIAALADEQAGVADAYFLAVGGDGTESVFMRDIQVARTGLQQQFDLENRSIMLLNHRDYELLPLASRPSIQTALKALDGQMNPEEDLLVIHLVSHGARDGELLLQQPGIELPNLSPQAFSDMLETLKAQRKLLVVSACFSGQWIDELKGENTWIMTSAREDRTSFGCGDDSEMTWFTKAVYQEVGLSLDDPDAMFERIQNQIRAWEEEIGMEQEQLSYPQMHLGEGIRQWLKQEQPQTIK